MKETTEYFPSVQIAFIYFYLKATKRVQLCLFDGGGGVALPAQCEQVL